MPSKQEILDQIAALQAEADNMGDEEDGYEVEIWDENGRGARLPQGQASRWLKTHFPDLFEPDPPAGNDPNGTDDSGGNPKGRRTKSANKPPASGSGQPRTQASVPGRYFGKRPAGK
jgi:hypothetical protein